MVGSKSFRPDI